jgi:hypothetical protein
MSLAGPGIIDCWGYRTHCHFGWTEGNPIVYLFRSLLFLKEGIAPVTRQLLRRPNQTRRNFPLCTSAGGDENATNSPSETV